MRHVAAVCWRARIFLAGDEFSLHRVEQAQFNTQTVRVTERVAAGDDRFGADHRQHVPADGFAGQAAEGAWVEGCRIKQAK